MNGFESQPQTAGRSRKIVRPDVQEYVVVPPDGGWGWVVVASAFYCNTVIDGIVFTFGMYLPEIVKAYDTDEASVALIGSLMYGLHLAAGPLCAALTKSFGFRPMVIVGSVMTFLALASASLHPPLWALTVLFGVFAGTGMCFVYMSSITVTAMYFSHYRILAVGVVVCGTGAGTVIFALAGHYMSAAMTWEQSHLVLSVSALLMSVAGLAFRPLEPLRISTTPHIPLQKMQSVDSLTSLWDEEDEENQTVLLLTKSRTHSLMSAMDATDLALEAFASGLHEHRSFFRDGMAKCCGRCCSCCHRRVKVMLMHPQTRKDLMSDSNIRRKTRGWKRKKYIPQDDQKWWVKMKNSFIHMDWNILKEPSYALYCISGALTATAIIMVFTYEKSRILANGFSAGQATALVATLGGANMCWRLFLGFVTLFPHVNYHALNVVGHCLGGVAAVASGFSNSISFHFVYCVALGLGLGTYAVFRPVLLLELVGMEKLSNATGISLLFTGLLAVSGPPLGGWVYAITGSYDPIFWIAGSLLILSGILMVFITGRRPKIRRNQSEDENVVPQI